LHAGTRKSAINDRDTTLAPSGTGPDTDIERVGDIAQLARRRRHPHVDVGVTRMEIGEPWQQPAKREAHRHVHPHDA
jgi:hypothetical protein